MAKSLADLKRENEDAEGVVAETEVAEVEQPEVEDELLETESSEEETESLDGQEDEAEPESWMVADEESEDDKTVPLSKHIGLRTKLKTKVRERDTEIESLKAEIEKLKQAPVAEPKATLQPPKAEDYKNDYGDVDFAKLNAANAKYMQDLVDSRMQGGNKKAEEDAAKQAQAKARDVTVNHHYELAEKLVQQGTLKAEDYKDADSVIVNTLDAAAPGQGRDVADGLIEHLSSVSDNPEKVWFKLGKDAKLLQSVIDAYKADRSGNKGVAMLARISQKYTTPAKRKSNAPAPGSKIQGDKSAASDASKMQRRYNDAHKKRRTADAFKIKREAKKAGVDVSKW